MGFGPDPCRQTVSAPAELAACMPDINCDEMIDFFDYADFVDRFEQGETRADFNGDRFIDFFDYADFVTAFETGC